MSRRAEIEILYFDECPNYRAAVELVHLLVAEGGFEAGLRVTRVEDEGQAAERRFLGSPTIRVDGRDVEPGAEDRKAYVLACRLYQTEHGPSGVPDPRWIVWALERRPRPDASGGAAELAHVVPLDRPLRKPA